jgi:hypothetical protein
MQMSKAAFTSPSSWIHSYSQPNAQPLFLGFANFVAIVAAIATQVPAALAVSPAPVDQHAQVAWSSVQENPFDGKLVYDKHFDDGFAFVTVWAKRWIRATYTSYWKEIVGYRRVWKIRYTWRDGKRYEEEYWDHEPIYESRSRRKSPKALMFAINGQIYTYEKGEVPDDLANALANAPEGNMTIRVVWHDETTWDVPIGAGTVSAWREIFRQPTPTVKPTVKR